MAGDYVYLGVLELHGEPWFRRWVWTVPDGIAFLILGFFAALMSITEQRTWILIRHALVKITQPIRLGDDGDPNSLQRLSQTRAISEGLYPVWKSVENVIRAIW